MYAATGLGNDELNHRHWRVTVVCDIDQYGGSCTWAGKKRTVTIPHVGDGIWLVPRIFCTCGCELAVSSRDLGVDDHETMTS